MNRGKEALTSVCERLFILEAIKERKRLDGREIYDFRNVDIHLGSTPGTVTVELGTTRVLACVSCHVVTPRPQRPSEGLLHFNVDLSPMASPSFELGSRQTALAVELAHVLERCFKESQAVDTESLCIIAGEKVWSVRVELHVLDHNGNLTDAASLATIIALKHFRRPDVTVVGEEATIHPVSEREPVPLNVHHIPLCVSFEFFCDGEYLVVDPCLEEEQVSDGRMTVAMNIHNEVCALQLAGGVALLPDQILRCSQIASVKVSELTQLVKTALTGTTQHNGTDMSILSTEKVEQSVAVPDVVMEDSSQEEDTEEDIEVVILGKKTAVVGVGGSSKWLMDEQEEEEEEEEEKQDKMEQELVDDEEEESTVMMTGQEMGGFVKPHSPQDSHQSASSPTGDLSSALKKKKGKESRRPEKKSKRSSSRTKK